MNKDLQRIKKMYGEAMMHLCRELFPIILETDGLLPEILESTFAPTRLLYEDAEEYEDMFKSIIYEKYHDNKKEENIRVTKTPKELMSMAGYDLYECHTEEEIQEFKKYYAKGEELCTFRDNRLKTNYVYFAVKKDVDKIKRKDFLNPKREDLYGTSVLSIQFTKTRSCMLSIKNRYNHRVENPDSTYSNNLDNIIEGLTKSFEKYENKVQRVSTTNEMPGYILASDGIYYKYNYEINDTYCCTDNIIIDEGRNVRKYPKEQYIVFDYFILDLKNKKIEIFNTTISDSFLDMFNTIESIEIEKDRNTKKLKIKTNKGPVEIYLNEKNEMIYLENNWIEEIENFFLYENESLKSISLPNVITIGNDFLRVNLELKYININKIEKIGDNFLYFNNSLQSINIPNAIIIGESFLYFNEVIEFIELSNVAYIGFGFLYTNGIIEIIVNKSLDEESVDNLKRNYSIVKRELQKR